MTKCRAFGQILARSAKRNWTERSEGPGPMTKRGTSRGIRIDVFVGDGQEDPETGKGVATPFAVRRARAETRTRARGFLQGKSATVFFATLSFFHQIGASFQFGQISSEICPGFSFFLRKKKAFHRPPCYRYTTLATRFSILQPKI